MKSVIKVLILLTLILLIQTKSFRKTNSKKNPLAGMALCLVSGALQMTAQLAVNAITGSTAAPVVDSTYFGDFFTGRKLRKAGTGSLKENDVPAVLKTYDWAKHKSDHSKKHIEFLYKELKPIADKDFAFFKNKLIMVIKKYKKLNNKDVSAAQITDAVAKVNALTNYSELETAKNASCLA